MGFDINENGHKLEFDSVEAMSGYELYINLRQSSFPYEKLSEKDKVLFQYWKVAYVKYQDRSSSANSKRLQLQIMSGYEKCLSNLLERVV